MKMKYIAKIVNGGMRDSITLLDKCLSLSKELTIKNVLDTVGGADYDILFDFVENLRNKDTKKSIEIVESIFNDGKDLKLFMDLNKKSSDDVKSYDDISITIIIPAFIISELRTAFIIGFLIYLPFIVIDMVVASTLMSMGMMMLPPTTISLPFKLLLFVLADGWNLVIGQLVNSFN